MKLHMWGTRGSLPRAITHKLFVDLVDGYAKNAEKSGLTTISEFRSALRDGDLGTPLVTGGHTSCNEILHKNQRIFVDMGTGFADASSAVMAQGRTEHTVFMTHMHWDHIMGLPFFVPIYIKGHKITIYHVHPNAPEYVKIQFNGVNFPVTWDQLGAEIEFKKLKLYQTVNFDDLRVTSFALDHPGGSFGYRFETDSHSLAIGVDGEYKRISAKDLGKDLRYYQNLDVLIFDGQYEINELASRYDWGHSSPPIGVDLALREGIRNVLITHHDPRADENRGRQMLAQTLLYRDKQLPTFAQTWKDLGQPEGPALHLAYDGFEFDLEKLSSKPG